MAVARSTVLGFLSAEVLIFLLAVLAHGGVILQGYEHPRAATAEAVITAVLTGGLVVAASRPFAAKGTALFVQSFALLGVCLGALLVASGIGPDSTPDLALHAVMIALLIGGLVAASRS